LHIKAVSHGVVRFALVYVELLSHSVRDASAVSVCGGAL